MQGHYLYVGDDDPLGGDDEWAYIPSERELNDDYSDFDDELPLDEEATC